MDYTSSHPWITFKLSLPPGDTRLWLMLGEIGSKIEHLSGAPLSPHVAANLHQIYLAKGVLATTAIEGNTLNEDQIRALIEGKLDLPKSQRYLQQEVQNILDVCNREARDLPQQRPEERLITRALLERYNRDVLKNLELPEDTVPGEVRTHSVVVGNVYRGAPAQDCGQLLNRLSDWLNGPDFEPPSEEFRLPITLIKAIVAHVYLAWIHPFGDGNGRTARLVEFRILFAGGVPLPASHLLSDHYNRTRSEYYRQLALASKSGGDLLPFIRYALQGFLDGIRGQINAVREQQIRVAWENFVHGRFRETKASATQKRRLELVLELATQHDWVDVAKIELLTPKLAKAYATAGDRMLQRDLNAMSALKLIVRQHGKARANVEIIQAFLPHRVPNKAKRA